MALSIFLMLFVVVNVAWVPVCTLTFSPTGLLGLGSWTQSLLQFVLWELLRREALLGLFNWLWFVSWRCCFEPEWFIKGHDNSDAWLGVLQVSVFPSASCSFCPRLWPNHIDSSSRLSDLRGPWLPKFSTRKKPSCPLERLYFSSFVSCIV